MQTHSLTVCDWEAKGLNDGAIKAIVRVMEKQPDDRHHECDHERGMLIEYAQVCGCWNEYERHVSPLGKAGDQIRAVCPPGEPCDHRGCLSHVTHVCEGCGRGHAGILLDVLEVKPMKVQDIGLDGLLFIGAIDTLCGKGAWVNNPWAWLAQVRKAKAEGRHHG